MKVGEKTIWTKIYTRMHVSPITNLKEYARLGVSIIQWTVEVLLQILNTPWNVLQAVFSVDWKA